MTRYDKRFLSNTEVTFMYTPGISPVVFEAQGVRFGCALCIEAHFPEVFAEYEQLDADCVLLSVMVDDPVRPVIAQAYAALYDYWVGYSAPAQHSRSAPAGIVAPGGRWIARCPANGQPGIAVADLDPCGDPDIDIAIRLARPWRRTARAGLYDDCKHRTTFAAVTGPASNSSGEDLGLLGRRLQVEVAEWRGPSWPGAHRSHGVVIPAD